MKPPLTLAILSILLASSGLQAQAVLNQQTSGWCSPDIANATGNVTVICSGVDPGALKRLSAELSSKKLEIAAAIKETNEWVRRYNELQQRLNENSDDPARSAQAKAYLQEGELEKAGAILDELLNKEETTADRTAENHYNRALVLELQLLPVQALPHLEMAYRRRPNRVEYGQEYGHVLLSQNDFRQAETVLLATLNTARDAARVTPGVYRKYVAGTLQNLGVLYSRTKRPNEAESIYREALDVFRQLSVSDPGRYDRDIALTLNSWATLYAEHQRLAEAEEMYTQALSIQRVLAQTDGTSILDVADTLRNLGGIYFATQRLPRAEANFVGVVRILRALVEANPASFGPDLARALTKLANLYRSTNRSTEAETSYREALEIFRPLAEGDPATYQPAVAKTWSSLAGLYGVTKRFEEARPAYEEAVRIYRQLAEKQPEVFRADFATTLIELATLNDEQPSRGCQLVREAVGLVRDPELKKRADARMANCPPQ